MSFTLPSGTTATPNAKIRSAAWNAAFNAVAAALNLRRESTEIVPAQYGGTGKNTSASTGQPELNGGTWYVPQNHVNVKAFGAVGDGVTDDTAAINAAIAAASAANLPVLFPAGTYLVTVSTFGAYIAAIYQTGTSCAGLIGAGQGKTTIKLADTQGAYDYIIGISLASSSYPSTFTVRDLTIDANIANNAIVNAAEIAAHARRDLAVSSPNARLDTIIFERVSVINTSGVWQISAWDCGEAKWINCEVRMVLDPNAVGHDTSSLYAGNVGGALFLGNDCVADGALPSTIAYTAIESHADNVRLFGNRCYRYMHGAIFTGVDYHDNARVICVGNTWEEITHTAFSLWSITYSTHLTGIGLASVAIIGNTTTYVIAPDAAGYIGCTGVSFWPYNDLDIRNVTIIGNTFDCPIEASEHLLLSVGGIVYQGVGHVYGGTDPMVQGVLENILIKGNVFRGFPFPAVAVTGPVNNFVIEDNIIHNCASSFNKDTGLHHGILISPYANATYGPFDQHNVKVRRNLLVDDLAVARMRYGIYLGVYGTTPATQNTQDGVEIVDNTVRIMGDATNFISEVYVTNNKIGGIVDLWSGFMRHRGTTSKLPGGRLGGISSTYEDVDGKIYESIDNLTNWIGRTRGTTAPTTGYWTQGSVCWNTAAAAAGAPGWVCVSTGTPGIWKAMASLAS